jgi:hypothetical protein
MLVNKRELEEAIAEFDKRYDGYYMWQRIKTALVELDTTPNTGSPKLFLLQVQDIVDCNECSDAEKVAGVKLLVSEQLRAGA